MNHVLKLKDWKWVSGSDKEMLYQDSNGEWFIGSQHEVIIDQTYIVEISENVLDDGYRHIVSFKT